MEARQAGDGEAIGGASGGGGSSSFPEVIVVAIAGALTLVDGAPVPRSTRSSAHSQAIRYFELMT